MNKRIEGATRGYFPVYWELFEDDNLTYKEVFFFHYLSEIYPTLKKSVTIDGVDYKRLADSYVQEEFDVSRKTIREWLNILEDNGYIKLYHSDNKEKGIRYFTITLKIDNPVDSGYYCGTNRGINRDTNYGTNRGNNRGKKSTTKDTKILRNLDTEDTIDIREAKAPLDKNAQAPVLLESQAVIQPVKKEDIYIPPVKNLTNSKNLKDIFSAIRNEADIPDDTKDLAIKYFNTQKGRFTVDQALDALSDIYQKSNKDWNKVNESINNSYLRSYHGFYPVSEQYTKTERVVKDIKVDTEADGSPRRVKEEDYARNPDGTVKMY